ncbi:5-histidylcysteine sulfoxide synthase [Streptomyces sp. NPDC098789]|uniref:5-histidylcysteine sulfoxide synthase n=1 Tax=Streptomyces sp. NPDC098789 TaxID=3366098 RepID=UPI0037F8309D
MSRTSEPAETSPREASEDGRLLGTRGDWWFTGGAPQGPLASLAPADLSCVTREGVMRYFNNIWVLQEALFAGLQGSEAFYRAPDHGLRHPLVFYYGHPAAFYANKLRLAGLLDGAVDTKFEELFEVGVDEMSWDEVNRPRADWPAVLDVHAYRSRVYRRVSEVIRRTDFAGESGQPVTADDPEWAVFMGIEHDRIHLETSSVLVRELPLRFVSAHPSWPAVAPYRSSAADPAQAPCIELRSVAEGTVVLGRPRDTRFYGWDNEFGHRSVVVPAFQASSQVVTNGQFLEFVQDGGYRQPRWWSGEGWKWRTFREARWPRFWVSSQNSRHLGEWRLRTLFSHEAMKWDWPVCVNYHEAKAFCAWRSDLDGVCYRLPTEAEYRRMRDAAGPAPAALGGGHAMREQGLNISLAYGSEGPVDAEPAGPAGFQGLSGNVWQWCEDTFQPLPGFRPHALYDDFSTPCFDGAHQMIMGGSFVSTGTMAADSARFHFRPHFLQHTGIRLVVSQGTSRPASGQMADSSKVQPSLPAAASPRYLSEAALAQYLMLHYDTDKDCWPAPIAPAVGFVQRISALLAGIAVREHVPLDRVLDAGCAVGGMAMELSRHAQEVVGVDTSALFIDAARLIAGEGQISYRRPLQGMRGAPATAVRPRTARADCVRFEVADAASFQPSLGTFDAVVASNVLCRVCDPVQLLATLQEYTRPSGLLLLATPWSWDEQFTEPRHWIGGTPDSDSSSALEQLLQPAFTLVHEGSETAVLWVHERRFECITPHITVWRRRP